MRGRDASTGAHVHRERVPVSVSAALQGSWDDDSGCMSHRPHRRSQTLRVVHVHALARPPHDQLRCNVHLHA